MGHFCRGRRPAEPESGAHLSKSTADSTTATGATDDAISWPRSDAAAAFATAKSVTLNSGSLNLGNVRAGNQTRATA